MCTPLGFIRLFGVVGQVLVKPHLMRDVNEEYHASYLEEASVLRKLENLRHKEIISTSSSSSSSTKTTSGPSSVSTKWGNQPLNSISNDLSSATFINSSNNCDINIIPKAFSSFTDSILCYRRTTQNIAPNSNQIHHNNHSDGKYSTMTTTKNSTNKNFYQKIECDELYERLRELKSERKELDKLRSSTAIQRNLIYPLAMLMLLFLTGMTVLIVVQNTLELLIGIKALPLSTRVSISIDTNFANDGHKLMSKILFRSILAIYIGHYIVVKGRSNWCGH